MAKPTFIACLATALMWSYYTEGAASSDVACNDSVATFRHKDELPQGVLAALGFKMADVTEPFRKTDAVSPEEESLPWTRFVLATQTGCRLHLEYQRGGRGYGHETALFERVDGAWILRQAR